MTAAVDAVQQATLAVLSGYINTIWISTLAVVLLTLALKRIPSINAATRHNAWWMTLLVILVIPAGKQALQFAPGFSWNRTPSAPAAPLHRAEAEAPAAQPSATAKLVPLPPDEPATLLDAPAAPTKMDRPVQPEVARPVLPTLTLRPGLWTLILFGAWLTVALLQTVRVLWSYLYLRGIRTRATAPAQDLKLTFDEWTLEGRVGRPVRLLVSNEIISPVAVGFFQPAVLLPRHVAEKFEGSDMDHVLLHELAHLVRRDDWTNLFARVLSGLFALHPLALWIISRLDHERENACDDWVVEMTGAPRPYALSLTRLFELCSAQRNVLLATGMAESGSNLGSRIEALLAKNRSFSGTASLLAVPSGLLVLPVLLLAGAHAPQWLEIDSTPAAARAIARAEAAPSPTPIQTSEEPVPASASDSVPNSTDEAAPAATTPETPVDSQQPMTPAETAVARASESARSAPVAGTASSRSAVPATPVSTRSASNATARFADEDGEAEISFSTSGSGRAKGHIKANGVTLKIDDRTAQEVANALSEAAAQIPAALRAHGDQSQDFSLKLSAGATRFAAEAAAGGLRIAASAIDNSVANAARDESRDYPKPSSSKRDSKDSKDKSFLAALNQNGYDKLTVDEIIDLKNQGVDADYIRDMSKSGWGHLSPRQLIDLRSQGVDAAYLKAARESGLTSLSIRDVIEMRNQGVRPSYFREIHAMGFGPYTAREAIDFATQSVKPEYFRMLKECGWGKLSSRDIVEAKSQGVNRRDLQEAARYSSSLSIRQVIKMKNAGVF